MRYSITQANLGLSGIALIVDENLLEVIKVEMTNKINLLLKIADYLKEADLLFGNLEGPISDKGTKVGSIYSFQMDPRTIEGLTFAGFNLISLANVLLNGKEGLLASCQRN